jgi:hypothetical protein
LFRVANPKTIFRLDQIHIAENFFAPEADTFEVVGLEVQPVADGQHAVCRLARVYHLPAFLRRHFHWLFAQNMLARLGSLDGMLGVQPVGRDHIDDIDVGIVRHFFHIAVIVDVLVGNVVLRLPAFRLGGRAGDDSGQLAEMGLRQRGCDLISAQTAKAGEGETEFFFRRGGLRARRQGADERQARGGQGGGFEKLTASVELIFHDLNRDYR